MGSDGLKKGMLTSSGAWAGFDTSQSLLPLVVKASNHQSNVYNANTGLLVITGTNLPKAVAGWDFSKLSFVSGDGLESTTIRKALNFR